MVVLVAEMGLEEVVDVEEGVVVVVEDVGTTAKSASMPLWRRRRSYTTDFASAVGPPDTVLGIAHRLCATPVTTQGTCHVIVRVSWNFYEKMQYLFRFSLPVPPPIDAATSG